VGRKPTSFARDAVNILIMQKRNVVLLVVMEILLKRENIIGIKSKKLSNQFS